MPPPRPVKTRIGLYFFVALLGSSALCVRAAGRLRSFSASLAAQAQPLRYGPPPSLSNDQINMGAPQIYGLRPDLGEMKDADTDSSKMEFDYGGYGMNWAEGQCKSPHSQSPIDFNATYLEKESNGNLFFHYKPITQPFEIVNDNHTLTVNLDHMDYGSVFYRGFRYELQRIKVHSRSEHTFNGTHKALELHLIHRRMDTSLLLTVAVAFDCPEPPELLQKTTRTFEGLVEDEDNAFAAGRQVPTSEEVAALQAENAALHAQLAAHGVPPPTTPPPMLPAGAVPCNLTNGSAGCGTTTPPPTMPPMMEPLPTLDPNRWIEPDSAAPGFHKILQFLLTVRPPQAGEKVVVPVQPGNPLMLKDLLLGSTFLEYQGSLTMPPCDETMTWFVRQDVGMASNEQTKRLHDLIFRQSGWYGNYRLTKPLNGRIPQAVLAAETPGKPLPPIGPPHVDVQIPLMPNPSLAPPSKAVGVAQHADKIAQGAVDHMVDLDKRLRNAAQMHVKALDPELWKRYAPTVAPVKKGLDMEKMAVIRDRFMTDVAAGGESMVKNGIDMAMPKILENAEAAAAAAGNAMRKKFVARVEEVKRIQREQYEEARMWRKEMATYRNNLIYQAMANAPGPAPAPAPAAQALL